jgi:hypothetical protein
MIMSILDVLIHEVCNFFHIKLTIFFVTFYFTLPCFFYCFVLFIHVSSLKAPVLYSVPERRKPDSAVSMFCIIFNQFIDHIVF